MGLPYFELKPRANADTSRIHPGELGALSHPPREHTAITLSSGFDAGKFGVTDEDIRALFDWLGDPKHQVAVVVGPTGSGKSTALPYRLLNPPDGMPPDLFTRHGQILITQPRIQATRNVAAYVAKDLCGSSIGSGFDVGFRYKDHPYSDWRNRLVYVTDGTLINWIVSGQIANLSVIMIDEAHERSLNIDLILGLLKKLLPRYPNLKLIVASATIDSGLFVNYFGLETAKLIEFQGVRKYKVDTFFADESSSLPYETLPKLLKSIPEDVAGKVVWLLEGIAAGSKPPGDILAFLQGEKPIQQAVAAITRAVKKNEKLTNIDVRPLYTTLPQDDQNRALLKKADPSRGRVVVTTNVAETSLTVEGIAYVVDSGLINEAQWNPISQTKQVVTVLHSKAGCTQRWGRAGRVTDGEAYCLYTENQFTTLFPEYTKPQIQRSDLEPVVLAAKAAGIDDLKSFDWIQGPPLEELERAPRALQQIGALDQSGDLTEHGLELQSFGEEPALAHLMATADRFCCAIEMATLIAMMKHVGLRHLLHTDNRWDATTRRAVDRIHQAMKKGCQDDVEFCLKLYAAWSEGRWQGRPLAPTWAILREWLHLIPELRDDMKSVPGPRVGAFREAVAGTPTYSGLQAVVAEFGLEESAKPWLVTAESAFRKAERRAWGRTFFVNDSLFEDKIEPERNALQDALSGHKKEEERRPVDFDLLDKVRIVMAYCLPERSYELDKPAQIVVEAGSPQMSIGPYRPHKAPSTAAEGVHQPGPVVQINFDSACYARRADAFVCGKQQVLVHPIDPNTPPVPVMHVSYLAVVKPEWFDEIASAKDSVVALGRVIARHTRALDGGKLRTDLTSARLFLDQVFPIGSRYECRVTRRLPEGPSEVELLRFVSPPHEIAEGFRGEEPEVDVAVDVTEVTEGAELVDTVLTPADVLVPNPEEDPIPAWVHLADDTWESPDAELPGQGGQAGFTNRESVAGTAAVERVCPRCGRHAGLGASFCGGCGAPLQEATQPVSSQPLDARPWAGRTICRLAARGHVFDTGATLLADVVDYEFDDPAQLVLVLAPVPEQDPVEAFALLYHPGDSVTVVAVDYDERPGDWLTSLVVREPDSGLEILLEPENLSFTTRGYAVKQIPLGTELQAKVEAIDSQRRRVYLSCLPVVEEHLNRVLKEQRSKEGHYEADAIVGEVHHTQARVFLTLGWSEPSRGIVHVIGVAGRGLYKPPEAYQLGEACKVRVWFPDRPARKILPELPDEIKPLIGVQRGFERLSWEDGALYCAGRMTYDLRTELRSPSRDTNYLRAIDDLYRFSNQLMAETMWPDSLFSKYALGTQVPNARVLRLTDFGAILELEPGLEGLVHKSEMTDPLAPDQEVAATVITIDAGERKIGLSISRPYVRTLGIPTARIGLLIGRGGATIRGIKEKTSTAIEVDSRGLVTIWGASGEEVDDAVEAVRHVVNPPTASKTIPASRIGVVIGRGGSTINRLREDLDVDIMLNNDNGLLTIEGATQQKVDAALHTILELVFPIVHVATIPASKVDSLLVDESRAIQRIMAETNTHISIHTANVKIVKHLFSQEARLDVTIRGATQPDVQRALRAIQRIIPNAR
jgi:HrpA-like RNA helicase/rRNA processing protein Krr1/Pno1